MENTGDSNSESDISDSWALIDEDSALEWNNDMGVGPRQNIIEESEVDLDLPRTSSGNELSDEDSIEVVADDHTDHLSDTGTEVTETKGEHWTENLVVPKFQVNNITGTVKDDVKTDVQHPSRQQKKYGSTEYTALLITMLIVGIAGGITLGYSWGSYASQSHVHKESAPTQHAGSLLARMQNEILFLNSQLRLAHSSLELAVSKVLVPTFKEAIKLNVHKKPKENSSSGDVSGMCTIKDYILQPSLLPDNTSQDICLASDKPPQNGHGFARNADNVNADFNSFDVSLSKEHAKMVTSPGTKINHNEPNGNVAVDTKEFDETSEVLSESTSFLLHDNLLSENVHKPYKDPPHTVEHFGSEINKAGTENVVGVTDPRPYTKLRSIVEKIYSVLTLCGNDVLTAFPSKSELLNILPQNMPALDFAKESFTSDNYEKIATFKSHVEDASQKLFLDIETSVNNLMQKIASKFMKFEKRSTRWACKLKRSLENSADVASVVDLNTLPIFQKCIQYQKHGHDERGKDIPNVKDPVSENKEGFVLSASKTSDPKKLNHEQVIEKEPSSNDHNHENENIQQTQNRGFKSKEISKGSHEKISEDSKKSRKIKNSVSENKKLKQYDGVQQDKETKLKLKNERDQHEKEIRKIKQSDEKISNMDEVHTNFAYSSREKYGKLRTFNSKKEKKFGEDKEVKKEKKLVNMDAPNKSGEWVLKMAHGRAEMRRREQPDEPYKSGEWVSKMAHARAEQRREQQLNYMDDPNKSGEWVLKMAHARAEQRRREHQSDWLFDRAESRKSSRGATKRPWGNNKEPWKNNKESFWQSYEGYNPTRDLFSSAVCNKTKTAKDHASQAWKGIKHHVKENVWRPIVDTAKSAKRAFSDFNKYHSRRE